MKRLSRWLLRLLSESSPDCEHRWRVLIEHYPVYASDRWQCDTCGRVENFSYCEPPEPIQSEICNLGHVHIVNGKIEQEEWPTEISFQ